MKPMRYIWQVFQKLPVEGLVFKPLFAMAGRDYLGFLAIFPYKCAQFHQIQIVQRYLTRKPKTQAATELKKLTLKLTKQTKAEFSNKLKDWCFRWHDYFNERSKSTSTGKTFYTHKRLRSAYLSLKKHLPYLFVYEDYKELTIPNTTNALDGQFADLKNKLRNHNGLSKTRKRKFIDGFFKA